MFAGAAQDLLAHGHPQAPLQPLPPWLALSPLGGWQADEDIANVAALEEQPRGALPEGEAVALALDNGPV